MWYPGQGFLTIVDFKNIRSALYTSVFCLLLLKIIYLLFNGCWEQVFDSFSFWLITLQNIINRQYNQSSVVKSSRNTIVVYKS